MTSSFDVVVVGSGPAGATAALDLARRGVRVALVDKDTFPREKTCGDGVPPGTIEALYDLGLENDLTRAGFLRIQGIRLGAPGRRVWETTFAGKRAPFYIARRHDFDQLIRSHALSAGAEPIDGAVKKVIRADGQVAGVIVASASGERRLESRVVVAADGATSLLRRELLPQSRSTLRERGVAIRGYINNFEPSHLVEFYFWKKYLPGYAWLFPMGAGVANVGVIMRADIYKKRGWKLPNLLSEFVREPVVADRHDGSPVRDVASWQLSYGAANHAPCAVSGCLFVGDAAGLVDSFTGEGIHNAVMSGRLAAEAIAAQSAHPNASAQMYRERLAEELSRSIARSYRAQRWLHAAPWLVDGLFAAASWNDSWVRRMINKVSTDFVVDLAR